MSMFIRNCMRHSAFALVVLSGAASASARPDKPLEYYAIPLYINIYQTTTVTTDEAIKWATAADAILKPAGVRVAPLRSLVHSVADGEDPADGMDRAQRDAARALGEKEIGSPSLPDAPSNSLTFGKGLKVSIVKKPDRNSGGTNGLALFPNRTIIMRRNANGQTKSAQTMAHELLHALGLNDTYADADQNHIMYGYSTRTGTVITPEEAEKIKAQAKKYGHCIVKPAPSAANTPAAPAADAHGVAARPSTTPLRTPETLLVASATMSALMEDDYSITLALDGLTADAPAPPRDYILLFDTDNRHDTGATLHGRTGIDWVVRTHQEGFGTLQAFLETPDASISVPLLATESRNHEQADLEPPGPPPANVDHSDSIDIELPRNLLTFTGGEFFDVGVITTDTALGVVDSFSMPFDTAAHTRGPQLRADKGTYEPGDPMHLTGWGYEPFELVQLSLDDNELGQVAADATGAFQTDFMAPLGLVPDFFFLTGEGISSRAPGASGTTVVNIPEPGAILLGMIGAVFAVRRRRSSLIELEN